ncbi:MAG TPA: chloride channel protein [Gemmatimonadaceae bacterium]|nr:chloride channel protein [Gemmatimonadaceae bacterium]
MEDGRVPPDDAAAPRARGNREIETSSTTDGLPVAPSLGPALLAASVPREGGEDYRRIAYISLLAIPLAAAAALAAQLLTALIGLITNISFYGRLSTRFVSPAGNQLGPLVIIVPVLGAIIVGLMARYGSPAIRGHGIPEAMENVLLNESRIPARVTLLKPLSAAVSIGTGGPFGAEGPIIATGGALGSLVGQVLHVTTDERKTLLASGAAAGMAATFGSPVSAVLLAIELLLFEYRPRSLIPVALASAAATGVRMAFNGSAPVFPMPEITEPSGTALVTYILLGALIGLAAVWITRGLYAVEDAFEHLPVHWMWWPAIGAVVVGVIGFIAPRTLGVGYDNIEQIVSGDIVGRALLVLVALKLISWAVALGSGTSGGTLAPLFTIGGGLGALAGGALSSVVPRLGVDARIAALVGMAAIFAGASHALLASVVFAFETTRQPLGLLPLLGGCTAAYLISRLMMRHSIMTERLARRGTLVRTEYSADYLAQVAVRDVASEEVVTVAADEPLAEVRKWILSRAPGSSHQGFPVVDAAGVLVGVVTRRDILADHDGAGTVRDVITRPPAVVFPDNSLREAADHMVRMGVGRLPVVERGEPWRPVGIITRSDLLEAHERRLKASELRKRSGRQRKVVAKG